MSDPCEISPSADERSPRISNQNSEFWDEMCGSIAFQKLGLSDISQSSLAAFDRWYFNTYPYLLPWLKPHVAENRDVVEIGLGFGSIGQFIASRTPKYTGVDIARGPVALMNYRLASHGLQGRSLIANVLRLPFPDDSQDLVVAIGSLHHVGDFEGAIAEIARVLRPGAQICGMVYSAYSLRTLVRDPGAFFKTLGTAARRPGRISDSKRLRKAADVNSAGEEAPFTEFFSKRALRQALQPHFVNLVVERRNANSLPVFGARFRKFQLMRPLRWLFALDLYFVAAAATPTALTSVESPDWRTSRNNNYQPMPGCFGN